VRIERRYEATGKWIPFPPSTQKMCFKFADPNLGDLATPGVSGDAGADLEIRLASTGRLGENRRDLQVRQADRGTPGICLATVST
jgi:hypothetical protein